MIFRVNDFEDWCSCVDLATDDYENEISVYVDRAWDDEKEQYNDEMVRQLVEEEVSASFPGAIVKW